MHLLTTNYFQEILKMKRIFGIFKANKNLQRSDLTPHSVDRSAEISPEEREKFKQFVASSGSHNLLKILSKYSLQENTGNRENTSKVMGKFTSIEMLKSLVKNNDINIKDDNGRAALIIAVNDNNLEMVKSLAELGADTNARYNDGSTILMQAASKNDLEMIELLLESGANINAEHNSLVALRYAVIDKSFEAAKLLVKRGANVNVRDNSGGTLLMIAATNGHQEMITFLLKSGVDINAKNDVGHTALTYAAIYGSAETIKLLVESGANINALDIRGMKNLITTPVLHDDLETVKLLMKHGVDINITNDSDETLLMLAVIYNRPKMVKFLMESGVNINAQDEWGNTALMLAVIYNSPKIVKFLMESGADISAQDKWGNTALMLAVIYNSPKIVKFLMESGADINAQNKSGRTALILAVIYNRLEIVKFLMESGADINAQDKSGNINIALSYAVHTEIIKLLLSKTADEDLKKAIDETAQLNPESLLCILHENNNLREIIKNNISNLIEAVQSKESRIESLNISEMSNYIKSLIALANLAAFNIFDSNDKAKTKNSIKFAAANSVFIDELCNLHGGTSPNTTTKMCYLGFLMTLTKLGFFNSSYSTTTTETETSGAETIVTEIPKITFQDKESGKSITVSVEPELEEYIFDFSLGLTD